MLALLAIAVLGIGTTALFRHWYGWMGHQLRLDHCIAEKALQLRDLNNQIEKTNTRIREARVAAAAGSVLPAARESLIAAAEALALFQDGLLGRWNLERIRWIAVRCGDSGDALGSLPALAWMREPPDPLGPHPLLWPETRSRELRLQAQHGPRASAALITSEVVSHESPIIPASGSVWHAQWMPARPLLRPSFD